MKIKYRNSEEFYTIDDYIFINSKNVRLIGNNIPISTAGFNIYDDEGTQLYINTDYIVMYEKASEYVEYTRDTNIYDVLLTYDPKTLHITGQKTSVTGCPNTILIKSGQGKEFHNPEQLAVYFDENGLPNYKVDSLETLNIVEISEEEKQSLLVEKQKSEFEIVLRNKLAELRSECNRFIDAGTDYNGVHFSYTLEDQTNISTALNLSKETKLDVPYHADNLSCTLYTVEDMTSVYILNQTNLTHHQTYHNQLKLYTKTLTSAEDVKAVSYGQELTGEYLDTYNMIMMQSKLIIAKYLGVEEVVVDAILSGDSVLSK